MGQSIVYTDQMDHLSEDMDLRRKKNESSIDMIVRRAHWLIPEDRELILAMFRDGHSASTIATLLGICPRQVRRRIKKLIHRLNDPCTAYVVANSKDWTRSRHAIAQSLFIKGRSMRQTTNELGISFHSVRKNREAIEAMAIASIDTLEKSNSTRQWNH